jgi:hypothetical protein
LKKVCKQLRTEIDIYQKDTDSKYARVLEAKRTKEQEEIRRLKAEIQHVSPHLFSLLLPILDGQDSRPTRTKLASASERDKRQFHIAQRTVRPAHATRA